VFLIRKGLLVLAVLFVIGWVVGLLKATPPTGSGQATTAGTRSATAGADPDCGVRKKDGSLDARECDLR